MDALDLSPITFVPLCVRFVAEKIVQIKKLAKTLFQLYLSLVYGYLFVLFAFAQLLIHKREYFQVKKRESTPRCLLDSNLGQHHFVSLKDVKLHYVANGSIEKPLMLLLHGFPEFWFSWRHQLREFAADYYVVALDLRGYGDSDKPSGVKNYCISKLIADIEEVIRALNYQKAVIVANDWGGIIAWYFASTNPQMINKLIILNAPHPANFSEVIWSDWQQFFLSWYIFFFKLPLLPELMILVRDFDFFDRIYSSFASREEIEAYKYTYSKPGAITCSLNYYRANFNGKEANDKNCRIQSPTLVIWGKNDFALTSPLAYGAAKYVNNTFTVRMIENGSHFTQMDKPNIVNNYIKEFLFSA